MRLITMNGANDDRHSGSLTDTERVQLTIMNYEVGISGSSSIQM